MNDPLPGNAPILMVDAEPQVRDALALVLREFGQDSEQLRRLGHAMVQIADYCDRAQVDGAKADPAPSGRERVAAQVAEALAAIGIGDELVTLTIRSRASDLGSVPPRGWTAPIANLGGALYALSDGDRVLYVGQSRSVAGRIQDHARSRPISLAFVVPCDPDRLDEAEVALIQRLVPPWNRHHVWGRRP